MPAVDLRMLHYQEIKRLLNAMEGTLLQEKAQKAGVREIAKPLKKDLLAEIPVNTGTLRSSIGYKVMTKKFKSFVGVPVDDFSMEIGATRKVLDRHMEEPKKRLQVYLLRFLNNGVSPHTIHRRRRSGSWGGLFVGNSNLGRRVNHPGFTGRKISEKIYDKHQPQFEDYFVHGAARHLERFGVRAVI